MRRVSIAAVLSLPFLVRAERVKESTMEDIASAPDLKQYISDQEIICGGPAIWSILTATSGVNSVQNINWGKMEAEKVAYIEDQNSTIENLEMEIASLAILIEERQMEELPEYTTEEQHTQLIEAAVGADSFGGLEIAQSSDCGNPRSRPRAPRRAFQLSEEVMDSQAKQFFKDKQWRLDPGGFLDTCRKILPEQADNSRCGPLCQRFTNIAAKISIEAVGETAGGSDELVKQHKLKLEELARARADISECSKAWGGLLLFRESMEELLNALEERHDVLRKAEEALDDAQWDLVDCEEDLEKEQAALQEVAEALEGAGQRAAEAKVTLEGTIGREKELKGRLEGIKLSLADARKRVERVRGADKTVADLKTAVSTTMLKMNLFSSAAVVQPLRSIGFTQSLDIDSLFSSDLKSLPATAALQGSVESLHEYCAITAMPAFDAVKEQVDLTPLCQFDQMEEIVDDLVESVADRTESVKEQLLWLKSWLNPYRGNKDMTKERAEELVRLGEPEGLQETIGVYHGISFFSSYLVHWRYTGKFQELLAKLKGLLSSLETAVKRLEDERESIKGEIADLKASREDAAKALEKANVDVQDKAELKAKVEQAIAELQEKGEGLGLKLDELEKAVAEAQRRYEEAVQKLDTHFEETTKPLKAGSAALLQLQEQDDEAEKLIKVLGRLLSTSEKKLQVSQTRMAEIKAAVQ